MLLAALASIGLGMVLGPEAPLIALAGGLAILSIRLAKKDAPQQVYALMAAAASFAAISSLFGSPIVGAIIIIEAAGLGGATLPVILLPGLIAAGIGSLVFVGMGSVSGLSTSAYAIAPLSLPAYPTPTFGAICWVIALAVPVAVVAFAIVQLGRRVERVSSPRPFVVIPVAAIAVAAIAIAFQKITGQPVDLVLFSGQDTMNSLVDSAATLSVGTLALLIVFKGLAYGISLGSARGGPTFPAMFLGIVAGLLAAHLPGLSETPAVAALMGAATVAVLRLPLSSVTIAAFLTQASLGTTPLIIVAVVVAYLTVRLLDARFVSDANDVPTETPVATPRTTGDPSLRLVRIDRYPVFVLGDRTSSAWDEPQEPRPRLRSEGRALHRWLVREPRSGATGARFERPRPTLWSVRCQVRMRLPSR